MTKNGTSTSSSRVHAATRREPVPTFSFRVLHAPIGTIMETNVVTVRDTLTVEGLLLIFLEGVRRAPVVDEDSILVGFVSFSDLVIERDEDPVDTDPVLRVPLRDGGAYRLTHGFHLQESDRTVADIMTAPAVSLPASATMSLAAALMSYEGLACLPVVDAERRVLGLLTARSLLRWFAQEDDYCIPDQSQRMRREAMAKEPPLLHWRFEHRAPQSGSSR